MSMFLNKKITDINLNDLIEDLEQKPYEINRYLYELDTNLTLEELKNKYLNEDEISFFSYFVKNLDQNNINVYSVIVDDNGYDPTSVRTAIYIEDINKEDFEKQREEYFKNSNEDEVYNLIEKKDFIHISNNGLLLFIEKTITVPKEDFDNDKIIEFKEFLYFGNKIHQDQDKLVSALANLLSINIDFYKITLSLDNEIKNINEINKYKVGIAFTYSRFIQESLNNLRDNGLPLYIGIDYDIVETGTYNGNSKEKSIVFYF